jgi:5'-nucleotidase
MGNLLSVILCLSLAVVSALGQEQVRGTGTLGRYVPLTIAHTNDLHSHFKPDTTHGHGLGGVARMATAIRRMRESTSRFLLVDAGDWSEGHVYYNIGGGITAVEMMNHLGYDAAVVGNHDWLNGPGQLLDMLQRARPRFALLGANFDFSQAPNGAALQRAVPSHQIIERGGLRIGLIGVGTYELIYDRYFSPVRITYPFPIVRRLAAKMKQEDRVDVVVVLSHNGLATNRMMAALPFVDVVVHSHDHLKLSEPIAVTREGKTAYIVEAEMWGHYLGRMDLLVDRVTKTVTMTGYELLQIDATIPEDPVTVAMVNRYDDEVVAFYRARGESQIFTDAIARSNMRVDRTGGRENLLGNLAADAYRSVTGADVAFEQVMLTSGYIVPGILNSVDILNSVIQIFNPATGSGWTLWTLDMTGDMLRRVVMLIYVIQDLIPGGLPSVSGLHALFDPAVADGVDPGDSDSVANRAIRVLEVGGRAVHPRSVYKVAVTDGILHAIEFLEQKLNYRVERSNVRDTGIETWRALRNHIMTIGVLEPQHIPMGNRFQILKPDLAVFPHDVELVDEQGRSLPYHRAVTTGPTTRLVRVRFTAHNYGAVATRPTKAEVAYDSTPANTVDDPGSLRWGRVVDVPSIAPRSSRTFVTTLEVPAAVINEPYFMVSVLLNATGEGRGQPVAQSIDAYTGNDGISVTFSR